MAKVAARTAGRRRVTWRIVFTGSECTGKTTLAQRVAEHLGAPWVPEAARTYAESRGGVLSAADVEPIAHATRDALQRAASAAPTALVADTDLVSTVVYARAYYGACPTWVVDAARADRGDLYVLCAPDLPWTPDGVRDRPSEDERAAMHAAFVDTLKEFGARVVLVDGAGEARTTRALQAIRDAAPAGTLP